MSTKILSQRSAVPAVVSRVQQNPLDAKISRADKERLLRIAKRPRKGPLNAIMDPAEFGAGSVAHRRLVCRPTKRGTQFVGRTGCRGHRAGRARDRSKAH
jgi:hypothetical protein